MFAGRCLICMCSRSPLATSSAMSHSCREYIDSFFAKNSAAIPVSMLVCSSTRVLAIICIAVRAFARESSALVFTCRSAAVSQLISCANFSSMSLTHCRIRCSILLKVTAALFSLLIYVSVSFFSTAAAGLRFGPVLICRSAELACLSLHCLPCH